MSFKKPKKKGEDKKPRPNIPDKAPKRSDDKKTYIAWAHISSQGKTYKPGDEVEKPDEQWIESGLVVVKEFV